MAKITINQDALKQRKEWKRHKVNIGDNIYRILPPFGDIEVHQNVPFKKWSVVWGLIDPASGKMRPINSPVNSEERRCPIYDYLDILTKKIESLKKQYAEQGFSEDQIREKLIYLNKLLWEIRPKHIYAYNACDKSGVVGILEIKTTAHKAMKKRMMEYINIYSQDPTSLNSNVDDSGVWFNITREGERKETRYDVVFNITREKDAQGRLVSVDDRSPLAANVVEKYQDIGYDLNKLYKSLTYDELKTLLILNLNLWAKDNPEVLVPGFTMDDIDTQHLENANSNESPIAISNEILEKEQGTPAIVKGTKPVTISMGVLDDDDDEDALFASAPVAAVKTNPISTTYANRQEAAPAPVPTVHNTPSMSSEDDFMKMAEGILNS